MQCKIPDDGVYICILDLYKENWRIIFMWQHYSRFLGTKIPASNTTFSTTRTHFCYIFHLHSKNYWLLIIGWKIIYYFGGKEVISIG